MGRRTLEDRRAEYLDIGTAIIAEAANNNSGQSALALSHVKIAEVAERAGVTKGAIYHIWKSQEDFWEDLLDRLLDAGSNFSGEYLAAVESRLDHDRASPPTLFDYGDAMFETMTVNPAFFARIGMFSYLNDEDVRHRLDEEFRAQLDYFSPVIGAAIAAAGRRLSPGVSDSSLIISLSSLMEGLCLQHQISEGRTPRVAMSDGREVTLFAAAAEALLLGSTEPIEGDDGDGIEVGSLIDALFGLDPASGSGG